MAWTGIRIGIVAGVMLAALSARADSRETAATRGAATTHPAHRAAAAPAKAVGAGTGVDYLLFDDTAAASAPSAPARAQPAGAPAPGRTRAALMHARAAR